MTISQVKRVRKRMKSDKRYRDILKASRDRKAFEEKRKKK